MKDVLTDLLKKLSHLEQEFASSLGEFALFALLLREESNDRWDLVVAAFWIEQLKNRTLPPMSYKALGALRLNHTAFFARLGQLLSQDELIMLSRVVTPEPSEPFVQAMNQTFQVEHGRVEFSYREIEGVEFQRGYVITSRQDAALTAKEHSIARPRRGSLTTITRRRRGGVAR